ncbi:glycosyl hydrolase [Bacteroides sp. AF16-49]|jgi:beta-glucosidase|nr:glycosyl hydrolase [Bacteroides sp. OM05-12]RHR69574.1 glycosyl hydrolase [Bacteroides sp. AF16-49]
MFMNLKLIVLFAMTIANSFRICAQEVLPAYLDESFPTEERIENALSLMTLEEKIAICHAQSKFSAPGCPRLGIPELWMSDGPHGVRVEFKWDSWEHAGWTNDSCTAFPALTCLAATFNTELSYRYGNALGEGARFRKKDMILGPGVNIYRTPLSGRNFEYMGEDPYLSSTMVVPYIKGVQKNGVSACVKHFALNNQEKWRNDINVVVSDRALNEIYLPAFKAAVQEGNVWSVMGSYNKFKGTYCSHNDTLINQILKNEWGFDGVMVTDWGSAHDTDEAARNGLDLEMGTWTNGLTWGISSAYNDYYLAQPFLDKIRKGELSEALLDEKVRRILRLYYRTGMNRNRPYGRFKAPEHYEVARTVAEEGIVLMKNENHFFPIPAGRYGKIAVIGENAVKRLSEGGGSSELKPHIEISPLQGIVNKYGAENVVYSMGYASGAPSYNEILPSPYDADSLLNAAVSVAKSADVVLYFGGLNKNNSEDCEGDDRKSMNLSFGQDKLIEELLKVNKNTGIILISGNAVAMPWVDKVQGLMQGWYLGSMAGEALANVISGGVNPSGKLPFSFPKKLEDNSAHYFGEKSYPGDGINQYYLDDILVGYRWHEKKNILPLFAFGHGLSYTTFKYGKPVADKKDYHVGDKINVSFTISNTGDMDGAEAVQIYVEQKNPSVLRPVKELKAFKKIFLKRGETQTINMALDSNKFAFYDEVNKKWVLEPDKYVIYLASASDDIRGKTTIEIIK